MAINEFYYILSEHSCYYKISNRKGEYIMVNLARDFFNTLANNKLLYRGAKKWGSHFGVDQFIGGVDINGVMDSVKELNGLGISATVDHLGEFVYKKSDSIKAKNEILQVIERIHAENVDCHLSVKLTQLGSDIDETFCIQNMREILDAAASYDIFINIDMEDYLHYDQTLDILDVLRKEYNNVGTVIQSYLYRSDADIDRYQNTRLRIVKGAYKESADVAYQNQEQIDREFIELAKKRLKGDAFTSIATHDHHIIAEIRKFVAEENIDRNKFEFQMLYGFRNDMQESLANAGYFFCTYIPFGDDWYGYFMRRLAERPQNINLIVKDKLYDEDNQMKKKPLMIAGAATAFISALFLLLRRKK